MRHEFIQEFDVEGETFLITRREVGTQIINGVTTKTHTLIQIWKHITTVREPPFSVDGKLVRIA